MKAASIILAALLQMVPICRVAVVGSAAVPSGWAWVATWIAGAMAALGSYNAVSGASDGISGLVKYSGTTAVGVPTLEVAEPMGQTFRYRISVSNPGTDFARNYFNCTPVPPGLTINTNPGAAGYLSGTPLVAGSYNVTLVAGNLAYPTPATAQATILIYLPNSPPAFALEPTDVSVLSQSNAVLTSELLGTPPFHYEWLKDDVVLPDATGPVLSLMNVQPENGGHYQLVVSNDFGSVTSAVVRVTVREPLVVALKITGGAAGGGIFQFEAVGSVATNYVVWSSGDLVRWTPLTTNWVVDGLLRFSDPAFVRQPRRFYRVSQVP